MQKIYEVKPTIVSQLYRDLKAKINRKIFKKSSIPWMKHKEIDILCEIIENLKPEKSFEWGSGFSTLFFPQLLSTTATWHSLEHNSDWFNHVNGYNTRSNVYVNHVPPDNKDFKQDGSFNDFKTYINFPTETYDFILVDGRARKDCLEKAFQIIANNGIVVLHDANRTAYHLPLKKIKYQILLTDYHNGRGGIWAGSKSTPIETVLDIKKHQKLWRIHSIIGKAVLKK